ncbi:hypothetical protein A1O1_05117 [Capronia coronata CBS 617.96]|uniref:Uncharacterized protein n=1 Tax=Capronia coronata CBS 617.96 TaxID=1182541 RepID=W9Y5S8_9EURO|nr:uncharacterized protein A1O1_05117 [Capronia coronata CBS 617.96]EXJ88187.1 hypothetical protein A1O1_05117 [Capronia coronata CBS 617.96]
MTSKKARKDGPKHVQKQVRPDRRPSPMSSVEQRTAATSSKETKQSAKTASPDTACLHQSYPAGMATPEVSPEELDLDLHGLPCLPTNTREQKGP